MPDVLRSPKPLGRKAYGSIGHLPSSRLGTGDHHVHEGQSRICLEKARDKFDVILVQEKLDGSCCSVAKVEGQILALGRAGYLASSSPFAQHHLFADWVEVHQHRFNFLEDGERVVGEWLAQAHATRYDKTDSMFQPFVPFDIMRGHERATAEEVAIRVTSEGFRPPQIIAKGPFSLESLKQWLQWGPSWHGAIDPVEGAVYRVERKGKVDFLAKWVRPDKVDGIYLPEVSGKDAVWNWTPDA